MSRTKLVLRAAALGLALLAAAPLYAVTIPFGGLSSDGHPVSGNITYTLNPAGDTITFVLENTTATTLDAGELFTGVDFSVGGLTASLGSANGIQRTVVGDGTFSDAGPNALTWGVDSLGGGQYQLNFHPNAKDALLGPPSSGTYVGANGSIKGNPGHTPFSALTPTFVVNVPNLTPATPFSITGVRFGTNLDPVANLQLFPEPSSLALALAALVPLARRRK